MHIIYIALLSTHKGLNKVFLPKYLCNVCPYQQLGQNWCPSGISRNTFFFPPSWVELVDSKVIVITHLGLELWVTKEGRQHACKRPRFFNLGNTKGLEVFEFLQTNVFYIMIPKCSQCATIKFPILFTNLFPREHHTLSHILGPRCYSFLL